MKRTAIAAGLILAALSVNANAEETAGLEEYTVVCAICHGESGKGNGPFAPGVQKSRGMELGCLSGVISSRPPWVRNMDPTVPKS